LKRRNTSSRDALHWSIAEDDSAKGVGRGPRNHFGGTKKGFSRALSFSLFFPSHFSPRLNSKSLTDSPDSLNMSTSTSSATLQGLGECVVCGKETSTRCSKCNSAGLDWMFFCGQEHQKLVSSIVSLSIDLY